MKLLTVLDYRKYVEYAITYDKEYGFNKFEFTYNFYTYIKDEDNGRCYRLEETSDLSRECGLVKKRIKADDFKRLRFECIGKIKKTDEFKRLRSKRIEEIK